MKLIFNEKRVKLLFKKSNKISKYLSPNIFFFKKKIIFSCSVRYNLENKKYHKDYSEIKGYLINFNNQKKKELFNLKPHHYYMNKKYISFISPFIFRHKDYYYCLIQAVKKNMTREIIILKTKNFKKWSECKLNLFIKNYNLFTPSFIADKKKKYIFYSKNLKKIYCNIYDKNFNKISKKLIINEDKLSENEIYAPYVIKIKNFYLMLVSFWINNQIGKIILLKSKDLIKWKKINLNIYSFNKNIKIISEPCVVFYKKNFFLFFEIKKKNNYWNIGYKMIDKIIL